MTCHNSDVQVLNAQNSANSVSAIWRVRKPTNQLTVVLAARIHAQEGGRPALQCCSEHGRAGRTRTCSPACFCALTRSGTSHMSRITATEEIITCVAQEEHREPHAVDEVPVCLRVLTAIPMCRTEKWIVRYLAERPFRCAQSIDSPLTTWSVRVNVCSRMVFGWGYLRPSEDTWQRYGLLSDVRSRAPA